MARTKNKKTKIWTDILAVLLIAAWAYFADRIFAGAQMQAADYPLIGSDIAGLVEVSKVWVFFTGMLFYILTSRLASSRFIGWLAAMLVVTDIMVAEPVRRFKELIGEIKSIGDSASEGLTGAAGSGATGSSAAESAAGIIKRNTDAAMAVERYGIFPWKSDTPSVRALAYICGILMLFLVISFILTVIRNRKAKNTTAGVIRISVIFLVMLAIMIFIPGLVMGSGPHWLYTGLMTLVAFVTYMYGVIKRSRKGAPVLTAAVTIVLLVLLALLDMNYRLGPAGLIL